MAQQTAHAQKTEPTSDIIELPSHASVDAMLVDCRLRVTGFSELEARYGRPAQALRHLGLAQRQAGALAPAIAAFKAAVTLEPHNNDLWRDLGAALDAATDADADPCFARALTLAPDDWQARTLRAHRQSRSGQLEDAAAGFAASLAVQPHQGDAHFGLALVNFARRAFQEAIDNAEAAMRQGYPAAVCWLALGRLHYLVGAFARSFEAFEAAERLGPIPAEARQAYARARALTAMIHGDMTAAIAEYAAQTGETGEDLERSLSVLFSLLSGYRYADAARRLGELIAARNPQDESQRYLNAALGGVQLSRAPAGYVESHFDAFAETFEEKLVTVLGYDVPARLTALLADQRGAFDRGLDLGCGTGLAAPHLAPLCRSLVGVDLSAGMLERASRRALYNELHKADVLDYLTVEENGFDLVFAADLLVYIGDLTQLIAGVTRCLKPGGLFALSLETTDTADYATLPSGRFAHDPAYLRRLAAPHFTFEVDAPCVIRLEANRPVDGALIILRRR